MSTGADAKNSAESFINNVSVEYRLDESATRYVKVFYDRNSQDPLEGQLTKTGAGLVLRRKTDRLSELFIFKKKKRKQLQQGENAATRTLSANKRDKQPATGLPATQPAVLPKNTNLDKAK